MQLWLLLIFLTVGSATVGSVADAQNFTWRDVVQRVDVQADGTVLVYDERTLSTDEDFGDAFICLVLEPTQSVTLLGGGAVSPGPSTSALQQPCEDGSGGTELVVRQEARVDERRVFFHYRLEGVVDAHSDVVEWYWQILEPSHPPVEGYELNVTIPGPLNEPYDAYVHRLGNSETPTVTLPDTRQQLEVRYARVPQDTGVEVRFLMPPESFTLTGEGAALERLLRDEIRLTGLDAARRNPWWGALALAPLVGLSTGVWRAARRYRSSAPTMRYPFEPPSDRPPAAAAYLAARFGAAPGTAFHATVMDLARRGYGTFESERGKFNMHLHPRDEGELLPFEREVLAYLRRAAAGGGRSGDPNYLAFAELKRYSEQHLSGFLSSWSGEVRRWLEGELGGPRLEPASRRAAGVWFALAVLAAAGCVLGSVLTLGAAQGVFLAAALLCAVCGAAALLLIPAWRREVAAEAQGWQGFKRTLSDYTRMKNAPDDFFRLWEVYYCYAAALGVAERFLKNMARAAPERGERVGTSAPLWLGPHASMTDLQSLNATTQTLSSLSQALSAASASASSGGSVAGGGGGGSSGSSSGGR
jgi:uncharacterized membrane protein YgcG